MPNPPCTREYASLIIPTRYFFVWRHQFCRYPLRPLSLYVTNFGYPLPPVPRCCDFWMTLLLLSLFLCLYTCSFSSLNKLRLIMVTFLISALFWGIVLTRRRRLLEDGAYFNLSLKRCGCYKKTVLIWWPGLIRGNWLSGEYRPQIRRWWLLFYRVVTVNVFLRNRTIATVLNLCITSFRKMHFRSSCFDFLKIFQRVIY